MHLIFTHLPNLPQIHSLLPHFPTHPASGFLFVNPRNPICLAQLFLGVGPALECDLKTHRGHTIYKHTHKQPTLPFPSSYDVNRSSCPPPHLHAGILSGLSMQALVYAYCHRSCESVYATTLFCPGRSCIVFGCAFVRIWKNPTWKSSLSLSYSWHCAHVRENPLPRWPTRCPGSIS